MNLQELREELVEMTGRSELDADTAGKERARRIINAASRFLDSRIDHPSIETVSRSLGQNETVFSVRSLRDVTMVTRTNSEGAEIELRLAPYKNVKFGETTNGYAFAPSGGDPMALGVRSNVDYVPGGDGYNITNIIVADWDEASTLNVTGRYMSDGLSDEADTNVWSIRNPELLIKAACYQLEVFYRNREGAADWLAAINLDLQGMDFDMAARSTQSDMALGDSLP